MGGGKKKKKGGAAAPPEEIAADFDYGVSADVDTSLPPAELKTKGNAAVAAGDHALAHALFTAAIDQSPPDAHLYLSNRSLCALALKRYDEAAEDAARCVSLKPDWSKGHSRLGAAHFYAGRHAEAVKAYAAGLAVDPTNMTLVEALTAAQKALTDAAAAAADGGPPKAAPAPAPSPAPAPAPAPAPKSPPKKEAKADAKKEGKADGKEKSAASSSGQVVGIDLGTTYSAVAVCQPGAGRIEVIANSDGARTTPSWVAFSKGDGTRLVGQAAKNQAAANPENTVNDAKRLIGRPWTDSGLQADLAHLSYKVEEKEGKPLVRVVAGEGGDASTRLFAPEQISAMVLEQLKADAEAFLGEPVTRAVITVPAHFNDAQRQATKDAGTIAGLHVMRIINEPTAAALAYGLDKVGSNDERRVLIFDLGGGTFDVSVLAMEGGIFEVKATGGNTRLGGEDFDAVVVKFLLGQFLKTHKGAEVTQRGERRLYAAAERAKRQLSSANSTDIDVESFCDGEDLKVTLTRAKFESLNAPLFNQCLDTVRAVLKDAALSKDQVHEVVLVGGSTRIPKIRQMLSDFFGGKQLCSSINPDEAVAVGAAVQAGVLGGGLAAAGGALAKASNELVLMDVVPLSLGIETTGRVMSTVVKRNTPIPCRKADTFTTEEDYQTEVDIAVYEGERASTDACNLLGTFTIGGLERGKRGEPQVVVSFDIDANGILQVSAKDKETGAHAQITITSTASRNSKDDVARMVREAEAFAAEDQRLRKKAEARRQLEDLIFDIMDGESTARQRAAAEEAETWLEENRDTFDRVTLQELQRRKTELQRMQQADDDRRRRD